ncbi:microtubule-associated serine/threonine-protein kinase 2-like isoform X3 [Dermacentor albipictus]|uniref:microtubule-associated serine/threonine-protein kinase 2-like isoform X3 n=1 Tax=Dermacentor albipictus TaxID=60249 RepID=UPI0031FD2424
MMPGSDKFGGNSEKLTNRGDGATTMPVTTSTRHRGGTSTFASGGTGSLSSASRSSPATSTTSSSEEEEPTSMSSEGTSMSPQKRKEMMRQKKSSAVKVLVTLFPRIPKVTTVLLEFFIKRENKVSLLRDPLSHFCQEQSVLAAQDCLQKLHRQFITYQDIRDMVENLMGLHSLCLKRAPVTARSLGLVIRKLTIIVGELATSLEKISEVPVTDWMAVGDAVVTRTDKMRIEEQAPFTEFIPRTRDIEPVKLLGAGGFGAVYKARYKPANLICTVKLIASDRFNRPKQACIDKVVASVVRSPFLVKYYVCFATKDAYVTVMEYVCGVDLMRVVERAMFLPIDQVRVIMAQLILAVEHLHLKGFLHRDIKVSNMLMIPGGRVKLIDFDTNKVCLGHFTKRVMRGYFRRTPFEFRDGESAGTIPYMAPEILKRRPYGRACDWWSGGVVFYKLMTGRVPFRGKTKKLLRDRIIASPLKWPKVSEHPHSANTTAKDMVYLLLKKNPVERLGSKQYRDIKSHSFFDDFDWNRLRSTNSLCNVPAIFELMQISPPSDPTSHVAEHSTLNLSPGATTSTKKRKLIKLEELTDMDSSLQRPLFTYASSGYKRLASMSVKRGSPAQRSQILVGDVVVAVNGTKLAGLPLNIVRKIMNASGDQLVLTVLSSSPYRIINTRQDMNNILQSCGRQTLTLSLVRAGCRKGAWYGFTTFEAKTWDQQQKAFSRLHIVQRAKDVRVQTVGQNLFPGDVLTHVDATPADKMSHSILRQYLAKARPEIQITIAPLSPLRRKRPSSTRLHETFMSDDSVGEPSSVAAEIND